TSANGEGVHGETNSTTFAAVAGVELNPNSNIAAVYGEQRGGGPGLFGIAKGNGAGVFGTSANGEGVHGETKGNCAAVAGVNLGNGIGIWGECTGRGLAGYFKGAINHDGDFNCAGNINVKKDILLANADCAEDFDISETEGVEPGTVMVL